MIYKREIIEAVRLGERMDLDEITFCKEMSDVFGCKSLEVDAFNFTLLLGSIYHYGKIQGVRQERIKRRNIKVKTGNIITT
jgi:hypothetical protein